MPRAAFSTLSDTLTNALLGRDFALYRTAFCLPVRIEPRKGQAYTLADDAALEADFKLYCDILKAHAVTDIFREEMQVLPLEDDWVEVTFCTHILRHAQRVVEPFNSQFVLRPCDGAWRIAEIRSTLGHINWTLGRAEIDKGRFTTD